MHATNSFVWACLFWDQPTQKHLVRCEVVRFLLYNWQMKNSLAIARAKELRALGLSLLATANATGLDYETTLNACQGIRPSVNLPDLPGLPIPCDIAPVKHHAACPDHVVAQIRQMRQDRYTHREISHALGVGTSTVANYAPVRPSTLHDGRIKVTPETHRAIRRMRYVEFFSFEKIAAIVGMSAVTVRRYAKIDPQ